MTTASTRVQRPDLPYGLAVRFGAIGFAVALALIGLNLLVVQPRPGDAAPCDRAYVRLYDPPRTKVDTVIDVGDAQAYAALAVDPTISDVAMFCDGTRELVYRGARPAFGWLIWAGSLGQPAAVPGVLFVLTAVGVGVFGFASVLLAAQYRRSPRAGAFTLLLPGTAYCIVFPGPEPFAVGLAMLGLILWRRGPRHVVWSIALFTVAVLMRDLLVVVPLVLAVHEMVRHGRRLREVAVLAIPPAVYVGWVFWLYERHHALPTGDSPGGSENTSPPFRGMVQALSSGEVQVYVGLLLLVVLVVLAVQRDRRSELTWCVLVWAVLAVFFGRGVWQLAILRVLLPLYAFGLVVSLAPRPLRAAPARSG